MKEEESYEIICDTIYEETANTEIYYHSLGEDLRGFLTGKSVKEILEIDASLPACTCGGAAELHEEEGMGTGYFTICCKQCDRSLFRSPYDVDIHKWDELLDACIRDWKAGLCTEDIEKMNDAEEERVRIREEDLTWKELHPNNMKSNPMEGYYSLVFAMIRGKLYGCKWTIRFQWPEREPMSECREEPVEAYNLFMERYFEIEGPMTYPKLTEDCSDTFGGQEITFPDCGVNRYGNFIRSYKTLEEAKRGAAGRCGWQGINRDTLLKEEDYSGKTAEEVIKEQKY